MQGQFLSYRHYYPLSSFFLSEALKCFLVDHRGQKESLIQLHSSILGKTIAQLQSLDQNKVMISEQCKVLSLTLEDPYNCYFLEELNLFPSLPIQQMGWLLNRFVWIVGFWSVPAFSCLGLKREHTWKQNQSITQWLFPDFSWKVAKRKGIGKSVGKQVNGLLKEMRRWYGY